MSATLLEAARRLHCLRPDWHDPSRFLAERDRLVRLLEQEAAARRQDALLPPTAYRHSPAPPDPRLAGYAALATARTAEVVRLQAEIDHLRRTLAASRSRPRPRRRPADERQLSLLGQAGSRDSPGERSGGAGKASRPPPRHGPSRQA
jgi:hypothetical protein